MKKEAKFIVSMAVSSVITACAIAMLNLVMDPYSTYHFIEIPGVNMAKPVGMINRSEPKVRAVAKLKPGTLILGTSRAELGLDPDHEALSGDATPVYNLALATTNIQQHLRLLTFVHGNAPLTRVILGLDFSMFNASRFEGNKLNARLDHVLREQSYSVVLEHFNNLLTYEVLNDSYKTFARRNSGEQAFANWNKGNGLRNPAPWSLFFDAFGHSGMFSRTESKFFKRGVYRSLSDDYFHDSAGHINSIDVFSALLSFCAKNGIDLKLFISPLHVRHQNIIVAENRWADFERWKRLMVDAVDVANRDYASHYGIWDFSVFSHVTTELVPTDTKVEMHWYWESEHYKTVLGAQMLNIIFDRRLPFIEGEEFGVLLSSHGIDEHLGNIGKDQVAYLVEHPDELKRLEGLKGMVVPEK